MYHINECHPSIAAIVNDCFYNNQIRNGISACDRIGIPLLPTVLFIDTVFQEEKTKSSVRNCEEAHFIKALQTYFTFSSVIVSPCMTSVFV